MFSALVITIRESFEASLLVSVVLALVTQEKSPKLRRAVWTGVGSAGAASVLLGIGLVATVGALHGKSQVLIEGLVMAVASIILTYVLWWTGKRSRNVSTAVGGQVKVALGAGSALGLARESEMASHRAGSRGGPR